MSDPAKPNRPPDDPQPGPPPEEPPVREPEPERLPDEVPNPSPDETPQPPIHAGGAERSRPDEDPAEGSRDVVENELARRQRPEKDAEGQFAEGKRRSDNSGVSSADPRVISGKENGDATFPITEKKDRKSD